jgi:Ca2+ transporting ATPase
MDTFASLALATEPPSDIVLKAKPYRRDDSIITPSMYKTVCIQSVYQVGVLLFVLFWLPNYFDLSLPIQYDHVD